MRLAIIISYLCFAGSFCASAASLQMWDPAERTLQMWNLEAATTRPLALATNDSPAALTLDELQSVIMTNMQGVSKTEIEQAAIEGILSRFDGQLELLSGAPESEQTESTPVLAYATIYDQSYAYLRIARVGEGLVEDFETVYAQITGGVDIRGLVIDLRFSVGQDYKEAAQVADRFLTAGKLLLQIGDEKLQSSPKESAISYPIAVLVNAKTTGAAEALAAILRHNNAAVVIGGQTAGAVSQFREYDLSNGQRLRVASGAIRLGGGADFSPEGVFPDIAIKVDLDDELSFVEDAYHKPAKTNTLEAFALLPFSVRPLSEAELARRHRKKNLAPEQLRLEDVMEEEEEAITIQDPALSRALDVLKALSVIKQFQPGK